MECKLAAEYCEVLISRCSVIGNLPTYRAPGNEASVTQVGGLTVGPHRSFILDNGQTLQLLTSVQGHHTLDERPVISGSIQKREMC